MRIYEDISHSFLARTFGNICRYLGNQMVILKLQYQNKEELWSSSLRGGANHGMLEYLVLSNEKIFINERSTFAEWIRRFVHDMTLFQCRIKAKQKNSLLDWITSLPYGFVYIIFFIFLLPVCTLFV
jgi:hypothetical protein